MTSIKDFKTPCCKAEWYRKKRADLRCTKCDADVTLHLYFLHECLMKKPNQKVTNL